MPTITVMSGASSVSLTVWSSTTVIAPSRAVLVSGLTSAAIRPAIELPSTLPSHQRVMLKATSAAVKASPFDQVTPLRTFRVYSVALSLVDQLSSSMPRSEMSALYSTRYSSQPRVKFASSDQSNRRGSFRALVSIAIRSVPPAAGSRCVLCHSRSLKPQQAIGCRSGNAQSGGAHQKLAAAQLASAHFVGVHIGCVMQPAVDLGHVGHSVLPVRQSLVIVFGWR